MTTPQDKVPAGTEASTSADIGTAHKPSTSATRRAASKDRPDYDSREEQISEQRKPMGPPLQEEDSTRAATRDSSADRRSVEDPVDPD